MKSKRILNDPTSRPETLIVVVVSVIRLMPVFVDVAARAVIFVPAVKPLVIPMLFIPVSAGLLPVLSLMQVFGVFGNGNMGLLGFFVAPVFFAVRPG